MPEYTITLDRAACDGIFACLVRDDRFVEDEDGLATLAPDAADETARSTSGDELTVEFAAGELDAARQAAAACPVDAITVEES